MECPVCFETWNGEDYAENDDDALSVRGDVCPFCGAFF